MTHLLINRIFSVIVLFFSICQVSGLLDIRSTLGSTNNETELAFQENTETGRYRLKEKHYASSHILDRYSPRESMVSHNKGPNCQRPAKCEKVNHTTCLGVKLPYSYTTLELVDDVTSQDQVLEKLTTLAEGLRQIPKCWAVIQPLLCSLYMPRCEDGMVDLPSQEMCKMTQGPCRILLNNNHWPSFPKCDNTSKFTSKCQNDMRELKFNTTGHCQSPLVQTDNSLAFYEGIEGCGIQCQNPLFTDDEQQQLYNVIAYGGTICFLFNLFTIITFFIDWRSANKFPPLIIFYINCCFMVSCIGWLVQFMPGARQNIVCRKDGTHRMSEPSSGENLSCVIIFVLVYYPFMAALVWFVILTYAWYLSFQSFGKIHDNIDKKGGYFHVAAWCAPVVLTIPIMALSEVDGSSIAGICFVGCANHMFRIVFLWSPVFVVTVVSGFFLSKVLYTLYVLKKTSQDIVSDLAIAKIHKTIVRISLFSAFMLLFVITSFVCHIYEYLHYTEWNESLKNFIVCKIVATSGIGSVDMDPRHCRFHSKPSVSMFQMHLLVFFCTGITMSSWVWTSSTLRTWQRFLRRTFNSQKEEPVRMKKHKAIAQAFANWKTFNNAGRLSISFHSSHEDPVDLNLDVNSIASLDFSSTWAAALPTLMMRRGAIIDSATSSNTTGSSQRRNSIDSEISISVRKVSVESRRHSLDSQVSVQTLKFTATQKTGSHWGRHPGRPKSKRRRKDYGRNRVCRIGALFTRTGSSTSQDSQLGQASSGPPFNNPLFPSLTPIIPTIPDLSHRRRGIAALNGFKFDIPVTLPGLSIDLSDDSDNKTEDHEKDFGRILSIKDREAIEQIESLLPQVKLATESEQQKCPTATQNNSDYKTINVNPETGRKSRTSEKTTGRKSTEVNKGSKQGTHNAVVEMHEKLQSRNTDNEGRRSGNKRKHEEVQTYHSEESENEDDEIKCENLCSLPSVDVTCLSESSSFCPELMRLIGANSGASVFTHHTLGGSRVRTVGVGPHVEYNDVGVQVSPREIATQTSMCLDETEHELTTKSSNSPQRFVNKGVQVSLSSLFPLKLPPHLIDASAPYNEKVNVPTMDYSYNIESLMQGLIDGGNAISLIPARSNKQKNGKPKNGFRSRSAEEKVGNYYLPV